MLFLSLEMGELEEEEKHFIFLLLLHCSIYTVFLNRDLGRFFTFFPAS